MIQCPKGYEVFRPTIGSSMQYLLCRRKDGATPWARVKQRWFINDEAVSAYIWAKPEEKNG